jgi:outer membrane protein assembly factor BamA
LVFANHKKCIFELLSGSTVLKNIATKITLIILSGFVLYSCSLVKRVPDGDHLLEKNDIRVNGEEKNDDDHKAQLYQLPNTSILGYHVRLHMYSVAKPDADSSYQAWLVKKPGWHKTLRSLLSEKQVQRLGNSFIVSGFSNFLKKTGEPPVLVDEARIKKSRNRLYAYYYKQGYFRANVKYKVDTMPDKRAVVNYTIETGTPYIVDSISPYIQSPLLDSLYKLNKDEALIKKGKQYNEADFTAERERITTYFRNRGAYNFWQNNINYNIDTVGTGNKANVDLVIDNESVRQGDSTFVRPFKLYKISRVDVYTRNPSDETQQPDSTSYNGFNIYSIGKLNYRAKAITDPIFITPGSTYTDFRRVLTSRYLNNLGIFNYPSIKYVEDSTDTTGRSLIAKIELNPRKKFRFNVAADFNHSNIQDFGIQGSLGVSIRNIFRGAETLQISTRGNIGSSRDPAITDRTFFNILEYGADVKLSIPRIWFPFNTEKIIPKELIPSTIVSFGIGRQRNIGLDKENFSGVLSYNWTPRRTKSARVRAAKLDLFNIQYIRNVNASNYFSVYQSSYDRLNDIAQSYLGDIPAGFLATNPDGDVNLTRPAGATYFIANTAENYNIPVSDQELLDINRIEERRQRLTENNLIVASNFTYTTSTREATTDNTFFVFKTKLESAGNTLSLLAKLLDENKGVPKGSQTLFDVQYAQYVKGEVDFIKHFDLTRGKVLAMRAFFGLAVPFGNATSIPFARSYFAGGSNDNRAWQSYSLGPGRSGGLNDFNEANLKMAFSTELRFNIFGQLNGAVFGDVGNIWNVFDQIDDPDFTFNGLSSFRDLAFGTGLGIRYDFNFFVVRFDVGFKTYNPGRTEGERWFTDHDFKHAVLNVGINYPF